MRTSRYIEATAALTLALAAIAMPTAPTAAGAGAGAAQWANQPTSQTTAPANRPQSASLRGQNTPSVPPTVVRVTTPDGSFHWGDAGIGAAGGLALAMLALGLTLVLRSQRPTTRSPAHQHNQPEVLR
jgi:hypothetical protein